MYKDNTLDYRNTNCSTIFEHKNFRRKGHPKLWVSYSPKAEHKIDQQYRGFSNCSNILVQTLLENLTDDTFARLYVTKFSTISHYI